MSPQFCSIGIDIGHSSVKSAVFVPGVTSEEVLSQFETVVQDWRVLRNPETALAAEKDTVSVGSKKFFIGKTAALQSRAEDFTGQDRNWVNSEQHDALLTGAWQNAMAYLASIDCHYPAKMNLVLGLPAAFFHTQKTELIMRAHKVLSPRLAPNQKLEIFVQSQSVAPLFNVALGVGGVETGRVGNDESWGCVEIGHYTTDFTFQDQGQEIDDASTSVEGVINIYQRVKEGLKQKGYLHNLANQNRAIREGVIKVYGNEVSVEDIVDPAISDFVNMVMSRINNLFKESSQSMNGILVAGGGAAIPEIRKGIQGQYPNAIVLQNPQFSVATGLCRLGLIEGA